MKEEIELEFEQDQKIESEQEREESPAKRQKKASEPSSLAPEGERSRVIRKRSG